jgi:putative DNA primase/helicase
MIDLLSQNFFDELFSIESEIEIERKYLEYSKQASIQKVKSQFDAMYRLAKKERRNKERLEAEEEAKKHSEARFKSMSSFGHPQFPELKTGAWECDWSGIKTENMYGEVWACKHPILPVEILKNIQTKKEKIKIAYKRRGQWKEQIFDRSCISSNTKIVSVLSDYGIAVTSDTANNLVKYLSEVELLNERIIEVKKSTSKMGWFDDEFIPFTKEEILFDAESSFESIYNAINSKGSISIYMNHIKELRKSKRNDVNFAMAVSLASALIELCGILPYIFHMYGQGGKGKTVCFMVAASIWGDPREGAYLSDAKSTKTAFEMRLNFLNNMPLICDDLSQLKGKALEGDFSEFIYMVCSGRGSERSNINLGLNQVTTWKNTILTNAEKPITSELSNGGEILRVIDFEVDAGELFVDAKLTADTVKENYGFIGEEFVSLLQKIGKDKIKERFEYFVGIIRNKDTEKCKEGKQIYSMASILLADEILEQILKDGKKINVDDAFDLIKSNKEMSDQERAYDYVMAQISLNRGKFESGYHEKWGVIKGDKAYINPNVFTDWAKDGNFNKMMFIKWAISKDMSEANAGRCTKRFVTGDVVGNYVVIKMSMQQQGTEYNTLDDFGG